MKRFANRSKQLLALLLAVLMIASVGVNAFAQSLGSVIVQLSGGDQQRHTVGNYQSAYNSYKGSLMGGYAEPMDGSNGNPDLCVPGLSSNDDMVPQGLTYWAEKGWVLISAYEPDDQAPSVVYALEYGSGHLVAQFNLQTASGSNVYEHVSGIAASNHNLYIADAGSKISYIPLSELNVASGTVKTVRYAGTVNLNGELNGANTSYASWGDGILWTGNFYIADNSSYNTKANADSGTMMLGYDLSGRASSAEEWAALQALVGNPSYCIALDAYGVDKVQCATVKNGFCYVGTSYGRTNDSHMYIFNVNLGSTIGNVTVNGHTKPAISLTSKRDYIHLPMTEGLMVFNGYLWNIFESAAWLYNGKESSVSTKPTDVLWRFDISALLGIDRELDIAEASGQALYKAPNVTMGDLSFIVPEVIYLAPTTANSSSFQYYANNTAAGAVVANYETTGKIYYSYAGASTATLSYQFYNENFSKALSGGSVTLSSSTIASGTTGVSITGGTSPSVSGGGSSYIQWALTYNDTVDGKTKTAYAYSFVYKPFVSPVGAAAFSFDKTAGHKDVQLSLLSWWTGVNGLLKMQPSNTYIGKPDDGSERKFPNTKANNSTYYLNPLVEGVGPVSPDNVDSSNWLNTTGNQGLDQTMQYVTYYKYNGGNKWVTAAATGDLAFIYADSSRVSNLNKLPNYKFSTLLTDDMATKSDMNYIINKTTSYYHGGSNEDNTKHNVYSSSGDTSIASGSYGSSTEGYYYNAAYSVPITSNSNGSTEFAIESAFQGKRDDGWLYKIGYVCAATYCPIRVVYSDKSALRTAVQNATKQMARLGVNGAAYGKLTSRYFKSDSDYRWIAFQNAYKNAMMALTRLDGSNDQALIDALNNALAALCTHYVVDGNGGTLSAAQEGYVTIGTNQSASVAVNVTATRPGYTFAGWSTDANATTGSASPITVGYNNTIYAIWLSSYTVSFNGNGATGGSTPDQTFIYGTAQPLNANGFERKYTVTYINNNGTANTTDTATYSFNGWKGSPRLISDATERSYDNTSGSSYKDFPQWTISAPFAANEVYHLEFDAKGSGVVTNYFYGASGYWQVGSTTGTNPSYVGGGDGDIRHSLTANYQHYAITWTLAASGNANVNKYVLFRALVGSNVTFKNVVFWKETGAATYSNQQSVNNLCNVSGAVYQMRAQWTPGSVTLPTPTREGYTFGGWYSDSTFQTFAGNGGAAYTPVANTTLYANWTVNSYKITYNPAGGSAVNQANVAYGAAIPAATTTRTGYNFAGWTYTGNGAAYTGTTMPAYDLTATAGWTAISYSITYDLGGGTVAVANPASYTIESAAITLNNPTKEGYAFAGWTGSNGTTPQTTVTIAQGSTGDRSYTANWIKPAIDDSFVLDNGLPVKLAVLTNDEKPATLKSVTASDTRFTVAKDGNQVLFTPAKMLDAAVSFTYTMTYGGADYDATVTVIPANNVYYEESFIDFASTGNAPAWQTAGTAFTDKFQNGLRPGDEDSPVYGFDAAYHDVNEATYSLGSAKYVTVAAGQTGATATFTFSGTGFDLYSLTDNESGAAIVTIYKVNGSTETKLETRMVNTYFGYKYGQLYLKDGAVTLDSTGDPIYYTSDTGNGTFFVNGTRRGTTTPTSEGFAYGWVAGSNNAVNGVYQVPVISRTGLDYGTYKVVVEPRYSARQDLTGKSEYKFYVDAVRIYDPIDPAAISGAAYDAYQADDELNASYQEVRDLLIEAGSFGDTDGHGTAGVAFLETGTNETLQDYAAVGPKNEVYLAKGQAIAFNLTTASAVTPAKVSIGLKMANGQSSNVTVYAGNKYLPLTINGATELYREINEVISWQTADGVYETASPIIIANTSDADCIISITKVKWSYDQAVPANGRALQFSFAPQDLVTAKAALQHASAQAVTPDTPTQPNAGNGRRMLTLQRLLQTVFDRVFTIFRLLRK